MAFTAPVADRPLTQRAIAYMNEESNFIADLVAPPVSLDVSQDETGSYRGYYVEFDRRELFGNADDTDPAKQYRAPGAATPIITSHDLAQSTVLLEEHAQKLLVPRERERYAGVDVRAMKLRRVLMNTMIRRERQAADVLFTAGNYATGLKETLGGAAQLDDTGVDPAGKFQEWIFKVQKESGLTPNVAIFGADVAKSAIGGFGGNLRGGGISENGIFGLDQVASLMGLDKIFVGKTTYNSANRGAAISTGYIWSEKQIALLYMPPELLNRGRADVMGVNQAFAPYFCYRFLPSGVGVSGMMVDYWYDFDHNGEWHRVRDLSKITQISNLTGYHVSAAVN